MAKVDWKMVFYQWLGILLGALLVFALVRLVRAAPIPIGFSVDTVVENCHVVDCVLVNCPDWYGMICDTLHDTTWVFALPEIEPDYDSTYSECIDGTRMMRVMLDEVTCWMSVVPCDSTFRPTGRGE